jgi:hypothetical protein
LNAGTYDTYSWRVGGSEKGTAATFDLEAADYTVGDHFLTVRVVKDGMPYNTTVKFTIVE